MKISQNYRECDGGHVAGGAVRGRGQLGLGGEGGEGREGGEGQGGGEEQQQPDRVSHLIHNDNL